jgi:hypothetical protein
MSKVLKLTVGALLLVLLASWFYGSTLLTLNAADRQAKVADIRKLVSMTGEGELGVQIISQMIDSYRTTMPDVPSKFWDNFMREVNSQELVELIVPIYDRHFTHQEIKELIAFYQSPLGVKLIQKMPAITQESFQAGQQWGQKLGERVMEKLQREGYQTRR